MQSSARAGLKFAFCEVIQPENLLAGEGFQRGREISPIQATRCGQALENVLGLERFLERWANPTHGSDQMELCAGRTVFMARPDVPLLEIGRLFHKDPRVDGGELPTELDRYVAPDSLP